MEPEQYALMARVERDHWWYAGMRRIVAALLADALPPAPPGGRRVLDAGCGTAGTTVWLRRYGQVVGVDLAAEAAPWWRERGLARGARAAVSALPFPAATFDLVTCFDVLYHRRVTDDAAALAEFWRVLRPGGCLLLRVPAYDWLQGGHDAAVHTRHRYTSAEVAAGLEAAGFVPLRLTYANGLLLPLAAAKRLGERYVGESQTEMAVPAAPVNGLFRAALGLEARLLQHWSLPAGLSVVAVARKPLGASPAERQGSEERGLVPRPLALRGLPSGGSSPGRQARPTGQVSGA